MRRTTAAAALLLVPALLLTGCSSSKSGSSSDAAPASWTPKCSTTATPGSDGSTTPVSGTVDTDTVMPAVSGAFGKTAKLSVSGKPTGKFLVHEAIKGTGATVGDSDIVNSYVLVKDVTTGKTVSDSFSQKAPLTQNASQLLPALKAAMVGHKVGSRVVVVAPPADAATSIAANSSASNLGVGKNDTLALVVDIMSATSSKNMVAGPQAASVPGTMPVVDACSAKAATISVPKGVSAPSSLKTAVLVKGTGATVKSGQTITVQYTGVTWKDDSKPFDSSWNDAGATSFQIGTGAVIKGWDQSLVGQTVGSRVEVVIPPSLGYGAQAQSTIPANSTLVFVVDILGAA